MNATELQLNYEVSAETGQGGIPVIIAAAGASSRMGGFNKQFLSLLGVTVLARTLLAFQRSEDISRIIVAAREEDINAIQLLAEQYMIHKLTDVVQGGENRQQSVVNALKRLGGDEKELLIHDGARPFVSGEIIHSVVCALKEHKAVTCGVKLKDTIKRVGENDLVKETLDRKELIAVQTPQGVNADAYKQAVLIMGNNTEAFTDDMSVMEAAGHKVFVVPGSYRNIKITTPEDIAVAIGFLTQGDGE